MPEDAEPSKVVATVDTIRPADVLLGRGKQVHHHTGNVAYREDIQRRLEEHKARGGIGRSTIAHDVLKEVHRRGGRFLSPINSSNSASIISTRWELYPDGMALEKIKQALRDAGRERLPRSKKRTSNDLVGVGRRGGRARSESLVPRAGTSPVHQELNIDYLAPARPELSEVVEGSSVNASIYGGTDLTVADFESFRLEASLGGGTSTFLGSVQIPIGLPHVNSNAVAALAQGRAETWLRPSPISSLMQPPLDHHQRHQLLLLQNAPALYILNPAVGSVGMQHDNSHHHGYPALNVPISYYHNTAPSVASEEPPTVAMGPRFTLDSDTAEILRRLREGYATKTDDDATERSGEESSSQSQATSGAEQDPN